jgi:hypothetical protein
MFGEIVIEKGKNFSDGTVNFRILEPIEGKPGYWQVIISGIAAPKKIEMSENAIYKIMQENAGRIATRDLSTTAARIGARSNLKLSRAEQARMRPSNHRPTPRPTIRSQYASLIDFLRTKGKIA